MFSMATRRTKSKPNASAAACLTILLLSSVAASWHVFLFSPTRAEATSVVPDDAFSVFGGNDGKSTDDKTMQEEVFSDWKVSCGKDSARSTCVLSTIADGGTDWPRMEVVELQSGPDGLNGFLLFPFGLALNNGATLAVDGGSVSDPIRFRTCLPQGCILPLVLEAREVDIWRRGEVLNAYVVTLAGDRVLNFTVSLDGFSEAFDRMQVLRLSQLERHPI